MLVIRQSSCHADRDRPADRQGLRASYSRFFTRGLNPVIVAEATPDSYMSKSGAVIPHFPLRSMDLSLLLGNPFNLAHFTRTALGRSYE